MRNFKSALADDLTEKYHFHVRQYNFDYSDSNRNIGNLTVKSRFRRIILPYLC